MSEPIDFAEIEDVKENVQPLRSGRNPKDLAKQVRGLKVQPLTSTVSVFEEACKEWEEKLATYGGSDPLEVWDEYIKWAQQNATSDKLSDQVVTLLQRCSRKFQSSEQYKEDPRYLRIWIKYIDTVDDPADIFEFLEANSIGVGLALFYTSWALVLELKKSMYAEAYQKLDQGLQRKAHPVEKVQIALKDFQHRMNQRTIETMKNASLDSKPAEDARRGREFGDQLTKKRQVSRPAPAVSSASSVAGTTSRRGLGGSAGAARSVQVQGTGNKAGFSIFCDDGADTASAAPGGFAHLPSEKEKTKENTRAATKWNKEEAGTIPQKRAPPRPAAAAGVPAAKAGVDFELFVDEDLVGKQAAASPMHKNPVRLQLDGATGRQRDRQAQDRQQRPLDFLAQGSASEDKSAAPASATAAAEQDFRRPSSKIREPVEGGAYKGSRSVSAASRVTRKPVDPHNRNRSEDGTGVAAYDRSMLRLEDGEELCPEEARALARYGMAGLQGTLALDESADGDEEMEMDGELEFKSDKSETVEQEHEHEEHVGADIPNETQPSPTFSNFAPKNLRNKTPGFGAVQVQTPLLHQHVLEDEVRDDNCNPFNCNTSRNVSTDKDAGTQELKLSAATPHHPRERTQSLDHVPPTLTKFGGDISIISKAANSTFFANSSRITLCPSADPNFSLHETEKVSDENCAPSLLSFTSRSEHRATAQSPLVGAGDFLSAANGEVSPLLNSKTAHNNVCASPDAAAQAAAACVGVGSSSSKVLQVHCDENLAPPKEAQPADGGGRVGASPGAGGVGQALAASDGAGPGSECGFFVKVVSSPTMMTKRAAETVFDLMPSPTQTCMPPQPQASPTLMTQEAADKAFDLMPSPTQTCVMVPGKALLQQDSAPNHAGSRAPIFDENAPQQHQPGMVNDENSCAKAASKAAAKPKGLRALAPATEEEKHPATARHKAEAGSPQFFSAAAVGASPTLMTKKAHEEAFDLMPSPTATVLPSGGRREEVELAPAKRFEFKAVVSPTINTKKAEAEAFDLMPSPTATVAVPSGAARLEFRAQKPADVPAAAAGGFMVREDTSMGGFIAPQKSADVPAAAGGGFMVREDTAMGGFIAPDEAPLASGAGGFEIREDTDMRGNGAVGGGGGGRGLQLRPEGDQPCASSGFMVREDTNLKGACFTEAPPACEDAAGSLGGFMVREDTCLKGIDVETHVEAGGGGNLDVIDLFASPSAALLRSKPPAAQASQRASDPDMQDGNPPSKRRGLRVLSGEPSAGCGPATSSAPVSSGCCEAQELSGEGSVPEPGGSSRQSAPLQDAEQDPCRQKAAVENNAGGGDDGCSSGGLDEIGTLYPELNTIAEGSSNEMSRLDSSVAQPTHDGNHNHPRRERALDCGGLILEHDAVDAQSEEVGQKQEVAPQSKLSPLSRAVRDQVAKAMERSVEAAQGAAEHDDAEPEREPCTTDDEASGACRRSAKEDEEALAASVSEFVARGGGDAENVEVLFWKVGGSDAARCESRNDERTSQEHRISGEGGRTRRNRSPVCYKELPINTKCRQGAGRSSLSLNSSDSGQRRGSNESNGSAAGKSPRSSPGEDDAADADAEGEADVTVTATAGFLPVADGVADGFSREEEAKRARKVKASVRARRGYISRAREAAPSVRVGATVHLQRNSPVSDTWHCEALLGKGNFASVYLLRRVLKEDELLASLAGGASSSASQRKVVKILGEANLWEMHVSTRLHCTLPDAARSSFVWFDSVVALKDGTWLVSEYKTQSSLQDVINVYRKANKKMDEPLVMFYAVELLRAVEAMHAAGILHCDIKPDNILLRDDNEADATWAYSPAAGFGGKGVELIDYGCAIDRNLYESSTVFRGRSHTDSFECLEMQAGGTWCEQADAFAVAATVHCLLHNEYMQVEIVEDAASGAATAVPKLPLKRYWNVELWKDFFSTCINLKSEQGTGTLASLRRRFEDYFEANEAKRSAVRVCLMKQALLLDQYQ